MSKPRAFLLGIMVLTSVSIAEADLILTLNGVDTSDSPLIIWDVQELLIAVEGSTATGPNDVSLAAVGGVLEALGDPNNHYSFAFDANSSEATISLFRRALLSMSFAFSTTASRTSSAAAASALMSLSGRSRRRDWQRLRVAQRRMTLRSL